MVDENTAHPEGTLFYDAGVAALRARFADEAKPEAGWPRWTLPFAWCFAIGIWLVVLLVIFAPELTARLM